MRADWQGLITGPRPGSMRDRRGRGRRGPLALPGPLSPAGVPAQTGPRERFDLLVGQIVTALGPAFRAESDAIEVIVEEGPSLPPEWTEEVPASVVTQHGDVTRVVVFRLPISGRCATETELHDMTWSVLIEQLAAVWQVDPEDLDPR